MELKRFDFTEEEKPMLSTGKNYLDQLVQMYGLNGPIRKEDFIHPEDSHLEVAYKAMQAQVSQLGMDMEPLAALIQRVVWMDNEIRELRRKNRNIRSKNNRLQGKSNGKEQATQTTA